MFVIFSSMFKIYLLVKWALEMILLKWELFVIICSSFNLVTVGKNVFLIAAACLVQVSLESDILNLTGATVQSQSLIHTL